MSEDHVLYTKENGIGIVTLNRPEKLNAMTHAMLHRIHLLIEEIKQDDEVRAVILTANGRAFSAGTDISDDAKPPPEADVFAARMKTSTASRATTWFFNDIPKPVIAAINGVAVGVGSELILHCDIRIAAESARFGQVFVLRGIVPDTAAGTYLLPRLVGMSKACELIFSGEIIDAREMLRIGLVSQVVPDDELMNAARAMAAKVSVGAPLAVRMCKQLLYMGLERTMESHQVTSRSYLETCFKTEDFKEGIESFFEKRPPRWQGR
ncbi:MAG: enoyl-CoA hydratase [Proteobacteria bacterium]|nr:enoyl-CoA hydratase [Pseudomonadota bacterium]